MPHTCSCLITALPLPAPRRLHPFLASSSSDGRLHASPATRGRAHRQRRRRTAGQVSREGRMDLRHSRDLTQTASAVSPGVRSGHMGDVFTGHIVVIRACRIPRCRRASAGIEYAEHRIGTALHCDHRRGVLDGRGRAAVRSQAKCKQASRHGHNGMTHRNTATISVAALLFAFSAAAGAPTILRLSKLNS